MNDEIQIEDWPIERLRPHQWQDESFFEQTAEEFEALLASLDTNGMTTPIETAPDGRIISGHHRWKAAKQLGWDAVPVWIRDDLEDEFAIAERAIESNLERRHMGDVAKTKAILRLEETKRRRKPGGLVNWEYAEVTKAVAEALGFEPRHARRLVNIVRKCPREVQEAVDAKTLTQGLALKVCELGSDAKSEIAERIAAGESPREVVNEFTESKSRGGDARRTLLRLCAEMSKARDAVKPTPRDLSCLSSRDCQLILEELAEFKGFFERLEKAVNKIRERRRKENDKIIEQGNALLDNHFKVAS